MNITCLKKDLVRSVDIASKITATNPNMPVLSCLVFHVKKSLLVIQATNLELSLETKVPAETDTVGTFAVPAHIIASVLRATTGGPKVSIEVHETTITLSVDGSTNTIKTVAHEDFPRLPQPDSTEKYTIESGKLVQGFRSVLYSASTSLIKPELASVYVYHENNNLFFVATDSFRLAEKKVEYKTTNEFPEIIIPTKNIVELTRILEAQGGDVAMCIEDGQMYVYMSNMFVSTRIIDGTFPNYKAIIPQNFSTEATLLKEDFSAALKKAQIFSGAFSQVVFTITPSEKQFALSASNKDIGEVDEKLEAALTGETLEIKFNHKFVIESMQSIKSDSVILQLAGAGKPMVMKGVGDNSFTYLVMPMNK